MSRRSSASLAPERNGVSKSTSLSRSRHSLSRPSAVSRARVQVAQKGWVTDEIRPISPCAPGRRKSRALTVKMATVDDHQGADRLLNQPPDLLVGHDLLCLQLGGDAKRHHLDETYLPGVVEGQPGQRGDVGLIEAPHDDSIKLDRSQAGGLRSPDALPHVFE